MHLEPYGAYRTFNKTTYSELAAGEEDLPYIPPAPTATPQSLLVAAGACRGTAVGVAHHVEAAPPLQGVGRVWGHACLAGQMCDGAPQRRTPGGRSCSTRPFPLGRGQCCVPALPGPHMHAHHLPPALSQTPGAAVLVSRDAGASWVLGSVIEHPTTWLSQPTLSALPDGRLLALFRTALGSVHRSLGSRQAAEWTKPAATGLPNPNSKIASVCIEDQARRTARFGFFAGLGPCWLELGRSRPRFPASPRWFLYLEPPAKSAGRDEEEWPRARQSPPAKIQSPPPPFFQILAVHNSSKKDRAALAISLSTNAGAKWSHVVDLDAEPNGRCWPARCLSTWSREWKGVHAHVCVGE